MNIYWFGELLLFGCDFGLCFRVLEFGHDLSLVAARVVVVGVQLGLLLRSLLAGLAAVHGLVLIVVEVFVVVEVLLRHLGYFCCLRFLKGKLTDLLCRLFNVECVISDFSIRLLLFLERRGEK